jgi:hypothetical protein
MNKEDSQTFVSFEDMPLQLVYDLTLWDAITHFLKHVLSRHTSHTSSSSIGKAFSLVQKSLDYINCWTNLTLSCISFCFLPSGF